MGALCRLTDRAGKGDKTNASLFKLLEISKANLDSSKFKKLEGILDDLETHMTKIRTLRNKAMFHSSLDHAIGNKPPISVTYDEIECSIEEIRRFLNTLCGGSRDYIPSILNGTDGTKLLSVLAKAQGNG